MIKKIKSVTAIWRDKKGVLCGRTEGTIEMDIDKIPNYRFIVDEEEEDNQDESR